MRVVAISALVVASTGCDALFGLTHVDGSGSDNHDAMVDSPNMRPTDGAVDAVVDAYVQKTCAQLGYGITIPGSTTSYRSAGTALATWTAAEQDCEDDAVAANNLHTHLVVLTSDTEASNVYSMVVFSQGDFWVGLSDRVSANNFRWVTDQVTGYPAGNTGSPWATGQPSGGASEDCVVDNGQVMMSDTVCAVVHFYGCECDTFAVDKQNY